MKPKHMIKILEEFEKRYPRVRIGEIRIDSDYCSHDAIVSVEALRSGERFSKGWPHNASISVICKIDEKDDVSAIWQPGSFRANYEWEEDK